MHVYGISDECRILSLKVLLKKYAIWLFVKLHQPHFPCLISLFVYPAESLVGSSRNFLTIRRAITLDTENFGNWLARTKEP